MPNQTPDWELLARYFSNESSPEESREILVYLQANPAEAEFFATIDKTTTPDLTGIDVESALANVRMRMHDDARQLGVVRPFMRSPRRKISTTWLVPILALAAAILVAVGLQLRKVSTDAAVAPMNYASAVGRPGTFRLPDHSRLVLGPGSTLNLLPGYGTYRRIVDLTGEAYFDVIHDDSRPFTVRINGATVRDVGTRFVVRGQSNEVEVAVTEGKVSLTAKQTPGGVILGRGDRGIIRKDEKPIIRRGDVTEDDLTWMNGKLTFRDARTDEVAGSLRRWYGIEVQMDPSLANRHLTASFNGESPDRVLEVIGLALGATVERKGDTAVIKSLTERVRTR